MPWGLILLFVIAYLIGVIYFHLELFLAVLIFAFLVWVSMKAMDDPDELKRLLFLKREPTPKPKKEVTTPPKPPEPPFAVSPYTKMKLERRNRHHLIVAPTGHGKTEFMKLLLRDDLDKVLRKEQSVVVIDTKGDLLDDLLARQEVVQCEPIIIDPRDTAHPFALGFIDFAYMRSLSPVEKIEAHNAAITLLTTAMGALDVKMTQKQETLFTSIFRLLDKIPDASFLTMLDVLKKGSEYQFGTYVALLDPIDQDFFNEMYYKGTEYKDTREQVARRLFDLLNDPTLRRALTSDTRFDFKRALDRGSLILVNISTRTLRSYAQTFGRIILSRLLEAMESREGRERSKLCLVYCDEAYEYLDESAETILSRGRSANVGLIVALPSFAKISGTLKEILLGNTAYTSVGALPAKDARSVIASTGGLFDQDHISNLPEGEILTIAKHPIYREYDYYSWTQRNWHAHKVFGAFNAATKPARQADIDYLLEKNRKLYCTTLDEPVTDEVTDEQPYKKTRRKPRKSKKSPPDDPTIAKPFDL